MKLLTVLLLARVQALHARLAAVRGSTTNEVFEISTPGADAGHPNLALVVTLVALPCSTADPTQAWLITSESLGVLQNIASSGCVCSGGNGAALTATTCEGSGPVHTLEIGYNITHDSASPVQWATSGLCFTVNATSPSHEVLLAPCAPGVSLPLAHNASTNQLMALTATNGQPTGVCIGTQAGSGPILSSVFGDSMVLQADTPFQLWGSLQPGGVVNATISSSDGGVYTSTAVAAADNSWRAQFGSVPEGGPYTITVNSTLSNGAVGPSVLLSDVHFGLVLFCSGQSNMDSGATPVSYVFNASQEIAQAALFPNIRLFQVGTYGSGSPTPLPFLAHDPKLPWSVASPTTVHGFSATCWLTGKYMSEALQALGRNTSIGLIESAWSATSIQPWLSPASIAACSPVPPSYPLAPTAFSVLYNAMVYPFTGMRMGGFVWYQGESNALAAQASFYDCALPHLIAERRSGLGATPTAWFGVVQISTWDAGVSALNNTQVAELRWSELRPVLTGLPNVTVASAVDCGDPDAPLTAIHPRNKQPVAQRLAAGAVLALYGVGSPGSSTGPVYASAAAGGGPPTALSATVLFQPGPTSAGLTLVTPSTTGRYANSSVCPSGVPPSLCSGYELQSTTGVWYPATAALTTGPGGQQALLLVAPTAPSGSVLNATSCGWSLWPVTTLYNGEGAPAYPWSQPV